MHDRDLSEDDKAYLYGKVVMNNMGAIEAALNAHIELLLAEDRRDSEEFVEATDALACLNQALLP